MLMLHGDVVNRSRYFFDNRDYQLLAIVRDVLERDPSLQEVRSLLGSHLHPHGIKEMAASSGLRIAYAAIHLLGSLQKGQAKQRLEALRSLHVEALSRAHSTLRKNTARVLLQIMKELVRTEGDDELRLMLARDFRAAASGKPRIIKNELAKYHLLEMPEEWNQLAFDHHVHDFNTKGRKSPTHLIMDAWIKGIRNLTVVYYNYVKPDVVTELLEAASIMDIKVRIGIELPALFRGKYIQIVWAPRGFTDQQDFINFFSKMPVKEFFKEQQCVFEFQQRYTFELIKVFNARHRKEISTFYGIDCPKLDKEGFLEFVGIGQVSLYHLAKYIYTLVMPLMHERVAELRAVYREADTDERQRIFSLVSEMNCIDSELIIERWLSPRNNPEVPDPHVHRETPDLPPLLRLSAHELLTMLAHLHSGYKATLKLTNLLVEDVFELLYDCKGMITHLEIFNLKDVTEEKTSPDLEIINELQLALNHGNVIELKRIVHSIIEKLDTVATGRPEDPNTARKVKMVEILFDIETLQSYYRDLALKSRIGSDSTGRSRHLHGMGLVIQETVPKLDKGRDARSRERISVTATLYKRITYIPKTSFMHLANVSYRVMRMLPGGGQLGYVRIKDWVVQDYALHPGTQGNIALLGGIQKECDNGLVLEEQKEKAQRTSFKYLNSGLKNVLKVLVGFIPAFLTFALTKDWWLLAYCGAFIWFGITGLRNIVQSVLGGGGFKRSPLLRWNSYVSWDRITDSLFFTGFSVPLLDYLVKSLLLDTTFGINTTTSPTILYTIMALANGLYITSHNLFRGLPKSAAFANFFRSILSIPLALAFNGIVGGILTFAQVGGVAMILQLWAAIISKAASDCVAGVIEGLADRGNNMRMRYLDYREKLNQLFETFSCLELQCPEVDLLEVLKSPKEFLCLISTQGKELENLLCVHALDFLHFWMYQPRSRSMLKRLMQNMSPDERRIFVGSQKILLRKREISQIFLDGLVGKNFSKPLAFYLDSSGDYLESLNRMNCKIERARKQSTARIGFVSALFVR
jgi:hypothetical protein